MTDFRLWAVAVPGPVASTEDVSLVLATEFEVTGPAPLWLKGVSYWRADAPQDEATQVAAWKISAPGSGTLLAGSQVAAATPAATGSWVDTLYPTPIALELDTPYQAAVVFPGGYSVTANYWDVGPGAGGLADGPLSAPNAAGSTGGGRQGSLAFSGISIYPATGSGNAANYWVQPIVTDVDPAGPDIREGSITIDVAVGVTPVGQKVAAGSVVGAVAVSGGMVGVHEVGGLITATVGVGLTVTGSQGLPAAPTSAVLCSSWAAPVDVSQADRDLLGLTDGELLLYLLRASEILWALSGRRWYGGGCTEEAVLRSYPPAPGTGTWPYHESWGACGCWGAASRVDGSYLRDGLWMRHVATPFAVQLPRSPVTGIVSVTVEGDPFLAYRLVPQGWLERTDGRGWQTCDGETVIRYSYGEAPPAGGRDAAIELAVEMAKDRLNLAGCRLPRRTVSISRQGISMEMPDPMEFLDAGRTGLTGVDLWLASVNPHARPQSAWVWSPDIPVALRRP